MQKLRQRVWWPSMARDVIAYIEECLQCGRFANAARSQPLMPIESLEPFQLLGMDFIGPLPVTPRRNQFILHVIDYFSRFSITVPSPNANKETVFLTLTRIFDEYVTLAAMYVDPGQHFQNNAFRDFLLEAEVIIVYSPSEASKSTGMVERANGLLQSTIMKSASLEIEGMAREYADKRRDWDNGLAHGTFKINSRHMQRIGFSPKEILYRVQPSYLGKLSQEYLSQSAVAFHQWVKSEEFEWPDEEVMSEVV